MTDPKTSRRALRQRLESLERAGVTHLPKRRRIAGSTPSATSAAPNTTVSLEANSIASPTTASPKPVSRQVQLESIRQQVCECTKCPQLASARTQTVFGVGNPHASLCFIGEAPGADEDRLGEPFVGRAGQLLTKIIEACRLRREDVYILNILKCRPPDNRTPLPEEIANCRDFLERQLQIIQPEFICCLGSTAAQSLLDKDQSIGKLRGRFHEYQGATVLCTYHPSYLLRNPNAKRDVWEDMKLLMRKMGVELA
jgi:DNA polymerase